MTADLKEHVDNLVEQLGAVPPAVAGASSGAGLRTGPALTLAELGLAERREVW